MKNLLLDICTEQGYRISKNNSGITIDLLIEGTISGNIVEYVRYITGCAKATVTRALKLSFPDRDPIKDSSLQKFLLRKRNLRFCSNCSSLKKEEEFYTNKAKPDGIADICKLCNRSSRIECYNNNPHKELFANNIREKRMKELQTPKWANIPKIESIYKNRPEGYHVDHIVPLNGELVSGLHVEYNLQYLLAAENLSKRNNFDGAIF